MVKVNQRPTQRQTQLEAGDTPFEEGDLGHEGRKIFPGRAYPQDPDPNALAASVTRGRTDPPVSPWDLCVLEAESFAHARYTISFCLWIWIRFGKHLLDGFEASWK